MQISNANVIIVDTVAYVKACKANKVNLRNCIIIQFALFFLLQKKSRFCDITFEELMQTTLLVLVTKFCFVYLSFSFCFSYILITKMSPFQIKEI
jgi:hypothetical protein